MSQPHRSSGPSPSAPLLSSMDTKKHEPWLISSEHGSGLLIPVWLLSATRLPFLSSHENCRKQGYHIMSRYRRNWGSLEFLFAYAVSLRSLKNRGQGDSRTYQEAYLQLPCLSFISRCYCCCLLSLLLQVTLKCTIDNDRSNIALFARSLAGHCICPRLRIPAKQLFQPWTK